MQLWSGNWWPYSVRRSIGLSKLDMLSSRNGGRAKLSNSRRPEGVGGEGWINGAKDVNFQVQRVGQRLSNEDKNGLIMWGIAID